LLENYIGQRVVFEITEGDEIHEHVGVFKDYSAAFIEFLDVQYPQSQIVPMQLNQDAQTERIRVKTEKGVLKVENLQQDPLLLQSLRWDNQEQFLNVVVDGGETVELHPGAELTQAYLHIQVARELDMIVPRSHCIVRHRAEFYKTVRDFDRDTRKGKAETVQSYGVTNANGVFTTDAPLARGATYSVIVGARGYQRIAEDHAFILFDDEPDIVQLDPITMDRQ
jgi:hypothetical protein